MANAKTIGVGLAGFGLAGRYFHAPFIGAAGLDLRAVVTSRANDVHTSLPQAEVFGSFDALLEHKDIALIVIATPNALHYQQACAALEAGKHLVIDKPATPTASEARELAKLAASRGLVAAAYHNRRWDSDYLTMKRLCADGVIGTPLRYTTSWNRHSLQPRDVWRQRPGPASGVLYDLGPHLIDQALQLFGRPEWIFASLYRHRDGARSADPDDGFLLHMGHQRLSITLEACVGASGPVRTVQLDGTKASFLKAGGDVQGLQIMRDHLTPDAPGFGEEERTQWGTLWRPDGSSEIIASERGCGVEFYRAMARAIEGGTPSPVPLDDAADVIEIIEYTLESARTGQRIALPAQ